jgi:hypothetical protein
MTDANGRLRLVPDPMSVRPEDRGYGGRHEQRVRADVRTDVATITTAIRDDALEPICIRSQTRPARHLQRGRRAPGRVSRVVSRTRCQLAWLSEIE